MDWKFGNTGDLPAHWGRGRKIEALMPKARHMATNLYHRVRLTIPQITLEDLVGAAFLGVIKAVDGFNPDRGRLVVLCHRTIHFAMCDECDRYNTTSRWHRERGEFTQWEPLDDDGGDGRASPGRSRCTEDGCLAPALSERLTLENGAVLGVGLKIDSQAALTVNAPEVVRISWAGTLDD